jgi:phosphoglycerate dehydrogenase-like enzyme
MDEVTVAILGDPAEPTLKGLDALRPGVKFIIAETAQAMQDGLGNARVLFNWSGSRDEVQQVMERAPHLEWIHARYAGLDRLLFPALAESSIPLTNGSGVFSQSLGEFVITGVLFFAKDLRRMLKAQAERRWDVFEVEEISGQTLGIVGYGDIGRAAAWRAKALGMRVLAVRRNSTWREGDEYVQRVYATAEMHSMLPECDYVVAAAPLTPDTKGMIGKREFEAMNPTAIIMNVGRGPVIDEPAMIEALQTRRIRGAALDVFDEEPLPPEHPFWSMENVLLSPHTADHTKDWLKDAVQFFIDQFGRWRRGETLQNIVDKRAGY